MIYALIIDHSRGRDVILGGRTEKTAVEALRDWLREACPGQLSWRVVNLEEPPATEAVMALLNGMELRLGARARPGKPEAKQ